MDHRKNYNRWKEAFLSILFTKDYAVEHIPKGGKKWFGLRVTDGETDHNFLLAVGLLVAFGLVMLFSAGSAHGFANYGDSFHYIKRQLFFACIGGGLMYFTSKVDYHEWGKFATFGLFLCAFLLVLVLIPGVGRTEKGATRWLWFFQPSEIAKAGLVLFYALSLTKNQKLLTNFTFGLIPNLMILMVFVVLLFLEPHMSCIVLIGLITVILLFVAGAKLSHFLIIGIPAVIAVALAIFTSPYRLARVVSFLDPFADKQGDGYQVVQSLYAIGSGGIFGVGLGQSRQKYQSLPEPQNDFVFSVLAEELGLVGAIILMLLFVFLIYRGCRIAMKAPDMFGSLLVTGLTAIVGIQAFFNIAVVTATVPNTGMPLPFFSYGGTALVITMAEMGIILNVSRQTKHLL